jgi:hypothetical protein
MDHDKSRSYRAPKIRETIKVTYGDEHRSEIEFTVAIELRGTLYQSASQVTHKETMKNFDSFRKTCWEGLFSQIIMNWEKQGSFPLPEIKML